jgi:hypothetical protein
MVNVATVSKDPSTNSSAAASPFTASTFVPANREASSAAADAEASTATSRRTRCRSQSVAAPGPGPSSSRSGPSETPRAARGSTSSWMYAAHSGLGISLAWFSFMSTDARRPNRQGPRA